MKKTALTLVLLIVAVGVLLLFVSKVKKLAPPAKMPPSTQVLMDELGQADRDLLQSLFLVSNHSSGTLSTGLLTSDGVIVTDARLAENSRLQDIAVTSSKGEPVPLRGLDVDRTLDLAFLLPVKRPAGGLELGGGGDFGPGDQVYAWGFSDNLVPPAPLLCMGFVAGFRLGPGETARGLSTRLVLGGEFASSYGGAPVFRWRDNQMVGLLIIRQGAHSAVPEVIPSGALKERLETVR